MRLPDNVRSKVYRMHRARNDVLQQLGREPTDEELGRAAGLSPAEVRELVQYLQPVLSLNAPLTDEGIDQ